MEVRGIAGLYKTGAKEIRNGGCFERVVVN